MSHNSEFITASIIFALLVYVIPTGKNVDAILALMVSQWEIKKCLRFLDG